MTKENSKKKKYSSQGLGSFLIIRFLVILFVIYVGNLLVDLFLQSIYIPFISNTLHIGEINYSGEGINGAIRLILYGIGNVMLSGLPPIISGVAKSTLASSLQVNITPPPEFINFGGIAIVSYYSLLVVVFIIMIVLTLLPYLVGGVWFIGSIRKKVLELIEADRQKNEEYERKRNLLLSDIAHDIKTPITAMSGYAKALNDGLVSKEDEKEYLSTIYSKSMRVSELINMLFEYIKLDSAEYSLNLKSDDLAELSREVAADMYQDMEEAGLDFDVDIPEASCEYEMDKVQMMRVITNLLSNSCKYLKKGDKVLLKMEAQHRSANGKRHYEISVRDNGEQIDDDFAELIFSPFSRADKSRSTTGGNGLGLSIAHKIVELHGGELYLDRNLKDGYTKAFVIKL